MSRMRDPNDIASKQIRNLSNAVPEIELGVKAVTESPTAAAAERLDVAKMNYEKAIASGKMARNLKAVSLEEWRGKTIAKAGRIPEGIEQAKGLLVQFHTQRNGAQAVINSALAAIPQRTLADSIRRMTEQVTRMSAFSFDRSKA